MKNEKYLKSEKHIKIPQNWKAHEMHTWKMKSTWLESEKHMKSTPHRWQAHEKYLKSKKHMKSTWKTCAPHAFPLTRSKWEICVQFSCFCSQNFIWKALHFSWKVALFLKSVSLFERPLARNCNPMFFYSTGNDKHKITYSKTRYVIFVQWRVLASLATCKFCCIRLHRRNSKHFSGIIMFSMKSLVGCVNYGLHLLNRWYIWHMCIGTQKRKEKDK